MIAILIHIIFITKYLSHIYCIFFRINHKKSTAIKPLKTTPLDPYKKIKTKYIKSINAAKVNSLFSFKYTSKYELANTTAGKKAYDNPIEIELLLCLNTIGKKGTPISGIKVQNFITSSPFISILEIISNGKKMYIMRLYTDSYIPILKQVKIYATIIVDTTITEDIFSTYILFA